MMKIVCKECKKKVDITDVAKRLGAIPRITRNKKQYNIDILCKNCSRVLIKGKEVPRDIIRLSERLNRERSNRELLRVKEKHVVMRA